MASVLQGTVYSGLHPVIYGSVVVFAAATAAGAAPIQLGSCITNTSGNFKVNLYPTPAAGQVIYATVTGGYYVGGAHPAIGLMTVAGIQGSTLAPVPRTVTINELTTVAATAALKKYIDFADCSTIERNTQTGTCLSIAGAPDLNNMAATVNNLVNVETGQASAFLTNNASTAGAPLTTTLAKLNTLASILAACVDSDGTTGVCTDLFETTGGHSTLMSAWLVASLPGLNQEARALYDLKPATPAFAPVLATVPGTTSAGFWTVGGNRYVFTANRGNDTVSSFLQVHSGGVLTAVAGSPFAAGTGPTSVVVDPTGNYVYVTNGNSLNISAYTIGANGALTPIADSPFAAGRFPRSVRVDPTGRYAYVANANSAMVSAYTIGADGALVPILGSSCFAGGPNNCFASGLSPQSVAVDPTGRYAYVPNFNNNRVSQYTIGADGALTGLPSSPCYQGGPNNCFSAGINPQSVAVDPMGRYAYVANSGGSNVSAYDIEANGDLGGILGSFCYPNSQGARICFAAGPSPVSVTVDPTGRYVYVANSTNPGAVSAFTIGAYGALTQITGSPFAAGTDPQSVTVDPTGRYVYAANKGSNNVSAYKMGADGALTPVAGSPFAAGTNPESVAVDPMERYVYVANHGGNVSAYALGVDGTLKAAAGSPFATRLYPVSAAMDPTGRYAYVANYDDNTVSAYTIGVGGALTLVAGSPFATRLYPDSVTVDPTGRYAYVANYGDNTVSAYKIGAGGALTPIVGSPFAAGTNPESVAVNPMERYVYVANHGGNVSAYTIDVRGALTPISGSSCYSGGPNNCFATGTNPYSVAVDPTGRYVYVANYGDNSVSAYTIGAGGVLTPVAGSPFAVGSYPQSVAVDSTGRYVYVANSGDNTVSAYTIGADGALTPVDGSPFTTGAGPTSVKVGPTGRYVYVTSSGGNTVSVYRIGAGGVLAPLPGSPFATGTTPASIAIGP